MLIQRMWVLMREGNNEPLKEEELATLQGHYGMQNVFIWKQREATSNDAEFTYGAAMEWVGDEFGLEGVCRTKGVTVVGVFRDWKFKVNCYKKLKYWLSDDSSGEV